MGKTGIPYADETWNVTRGCGRVSAGCDHCWALRQAARFAKSGEPFFGLVKRDAAASADGLRPRLPSLWRWAGRSMFVESKIEEPLHWRRPRTVFVCSMSDLFHEGITDEQIAAVWSVMGQCPQHRFLVFTKRPDRIEAWFRWVGQLRGVANAAVDLPNVTVMVSAENQASLDARLPPLLKCIGPMLGVSMGVSLEPLLGPVEFVLSELELLSWVIVGAESGPGRRPMELDWVRSIRDQCVAAGVKFYFKQAVDGAGKMVTLPELDGQRWDETLPLPEVGQLPLPEVGQ